MKKIDFWDIVPLWLCTLRTFFIKDANPDPPRPDIQKKEFVSTITSLENISDIQKKEILEACSGEGEILSFEEEERVARVLQKFQAIYSKEKRKLDKRLKAAVHQGRDEVVKVTNEYCNYLKYVDDDIKIMIILIGNS